MARAYVFHGRVDEAGVLVVADAPRWRARLAKMRGKDVEIRLARKPEAKSLDQLGYLWAVVYPTFAEHCGDSSEAIHEACKEKLLREPVQSKLGDYFRVKSVSELSMSELSEYIEEVRRLAAQMRCYIPGPNEPCEVTL